MTDCLRCDDTGWLGDCGQARVLILARDGCDGQGRWCCRHHPDPLASSPGDMPCPACRPDTTTEES